MARQNPRMLESAPSPERHAATSLESAQVPRDSAGDLTGWVRTFVALWPPPAVNETLLGLCEADDRLRWIPPERRHVTLAFLGPLPASDLAAVRAVLTGAVAACPPPVAEVGPATERLGPGVLCLPVAGLDALAANVGEALRSAGFNLEERRFKGHLTVARARGRRRVPASATGLPAAGRWRVREVTVAVSLPEPSGHRYEVVARLGVGS